MNQKTTSKEHNWTYDSDDIKYYYIKHRMMNPYGSITINDKTPWERLLDKWEKIADKLLELLEDD